MPRLHDHMSPDEIEHFMTHIIEVADGEKSDEDPEWNALVAAAQRISEREGFLATDELLED